MSHLYERIREQRGMNYGDYAYIEAFPRGMFQFFPDPNLARRAQIFEVWIRPVAPENAQMALRIATHELEKLVRDGLTGEQFEATRNYLMKNVYLMTANQDQQARLRARFRLVRHGRVHRLPCASGSASSPVDGREPRDPEAPLGEGPLRGDRREGRPRPRGASGRRTSSPRSGTTARSPRSCSPRTRSMGARKLGIRAEAVHITPVDEVFKK